MINLPTLLFLSILTAGCQIINTTKTINLPGEGKADVVINKTKNSGNYHFVYGKLSIENLKKKLNPSISPAFVWRTTKFSVKKFM